MSLTITERCWQQASGLRALTLYMLSSALAVACILMNSYLTIHHYTISPLDILGRILLAWVTSSWLLYAASKIYQQLPIAKRFNLNGFSRRVLLATYTLSVGLVTNFNMLPAKTSISFIRILIYAIAAYVYLKQLYILCKAKQTLFEEKRVIIWIADLLSLVFLPIVIVTWHKTLVNYPMPKREYSNKKFLALLTFCLLFATNIWLQPNEYYFQDLLNLKSDWQILLPIRFHYRDFQLAYIKPVKNQNHDCTRKVAPLNIPCVEDQNVIDFAVAAMEFIGTRNPDNSDQVLRQAAKFYTSYGWIEYISLAASNDSMFTMQQKKVHLKAELASKATILKQGLLRKRYTWVVKFPMKISLTTTTGHKSLIRNMRIWVQRTNDNMQGIGIEHAAMMVGNINSLQAAIQLKHILS